MTRIAKTQPQTRSKTKPASAVAATVIEPQTAGPKGKIGLLVALLRQTGGAGIDEMVAATGWQAHSVRGAISGSIKKTLGLTVVSEKTDTGRRYRIATAVSAE